MFPQRSVLVVDGSGETREVLKTALRRRGLRTLEANRACQGLELARQHRPDLIVLDLEFEGPNPEETCARFARELQEHPAHLMVLSCEETCEGSCRRVADTSRGDLCEYVSKPYHYGPLIRRIEELVGVTGPALARCA